MEIEYVNNENWAPHPTFFPPPAFNQLTQTYPPYYNCMGWTAPPQIPEIFSRKVFVGGLPPDIDHEEIQNEFLRFGNLSVDWPHRAETRAIFPPKGYAFLIFNSEISVHYLLNNCKVEQNKHFYTVSSPSIKDKPVQIRPWQLCDTQVIFEPTYVPDDKLSVFVGGVPRPMKALELGHLLERRVGGVCEAHIEVDAEYKYPKGAARVSFTNKHSYMAAISARFIDVKSDDYEKQIEVKPFVLEDQWCDSCHCRPAPLFCAHVSCLVYLCEQCWPISHSPNSQRACHKPVIKEKNVRPRGAASSKWKCLQ